MNWIFGVIGAIVGLLTLPSNLRSFQDSNWDPPAKLYFLIGAGAASFDVFVYFILPIETEANNNITLGLSQMTVKQAESMLLLNTILLGIGCIVIIWMMKQFK